MRLVLAAVVWIASAAMGAAQHWQVMQEEFVSLEYRDAANEYSMLAIHCHRTGSDLYVPLKNGVDDLGGRHSLTMHFGGGRSEHVPLKAECGFDQLCEAGKKVEMYRTPLRGRAARDLALRAASASRFEMVAPGVALNAPASQREFREFLRLCNSRRNR